VNSLIKCESPDPVVVSRVLPPVSPAFQRPVAAPMTLARFCGGPPTGVTRSWRCRKTVSAPFLSFRLFATMALFSVLTVGLTLPPAFGEFKAQPREQAAPSAAFLEALQVADSFLWAWVARDAESGLRLISDRLRAKAGDERWRRQFIVGLSNPHHQAFEIGRGRLMSTNRYEFPVTLYEFYTGERAGERYQSSLEVVKEGQVWRVDRLPITSDNQ